MYKHMTLLTKGWGKRLDTFQDKSIILEIENDFCIVCDGLLMDGDMLIRDISPSKFFHIREIMRHAHM